jgi:hypothetical protein
MDHYYLDDWYWGHLIKNVEDLLSGSDDDESCTTASLSSFGSSATLDEDLRKVMTIHVSAFVPAKSYRGRYIERKKQYMMPEYWNRLVDKIFQGKGLLSLSHNNENAASLTLVALYEGSDTVRDGSHTYKCVYKCGKIEVDITWRIASSSDSTVNTNMKTVNGVPRNDTDIGKIGMY